MALYFGTTDSLFQTIGKFFFQNIDNFFQNIDKKYQSRCFPTPRRQKTSATSDQSWTPDETRLCTQVARNKTGGGPKRTVNTMTQGSCHDTGNAHAQRKLYMTEHDWKKLKGHCDRQRPLKDIP